MQVAGYACNMPGRVGAPSLGDRIARLLAGTSVRDRRRWVGPVIAAVGAAVLIWLAMPHVPWYVKLPLALLALGYRRSRPPIWVTATRPSPATHQQALGTLPPPCGEGRGGGLISQ